MKKWSTESRWLVVAVVVVIVVVVAVDLDGKSPSCEDKGMAEVVEVVAARGQSSE